MVAESTDSRMAQLVLALEKIAGGELATRIPVSSAQDQLESVIAGFNLMATELMSSQAELEARVKSRTAMLMDAFRKMELMALTDPLTQLRNRTALETVLESSLFGADLNGPPAVLVMDLNSFKLINDTLGHAAGDTVLQVVAERLRASVRKEDTAVRLGGDEFAIVLQNTSAARAMHVANRIVKVLAQPFKVEDTVLSIVASIGVAVPNPGDSALDLILHADTAMYAAKRRANADVALFTPALLKERQLHRALATELRNAIDSNQMLLHYQPVVELSTGKMVGVEALVRWQHPSRGLVMPDEFIDLAEETGAMDQLSAWVLQEALAQLRAWQETLELDPRFTMRVNISATQLQHPELLDDVQRILLAERIDPKSLVLELTEYSMVTGNEWDLYSFKGLRNLGVGLAIDDFGTGYSSISYLRTLPVDGVKMDKSLIGTPTQAQTQRPFIAAILQLVRSCQLTSTFEGVETREQAAMLAELGCEDGQGYYFSRPVSASDINDTLIQRFLTIPWRTDDPAHLVVTPSPNAPESSRMS